jgi:CHAD domain-containing protein
MAGMLKKHESAGKGTIRLLRRESKKALRDLQQIRQAKSSQAPALHDSVHSARKHLKRARAVLRLLRTNLGSDIYHAENACLRDAAQPLANVRDAQVLVHSFAAGCGTGIVAAT